MARGPGDGTALADLVGLLHDRRCDVLARMRDAIPRETAVYARLPSEADRAAWEVGIARCLDLFLAVAVEGRDLTAEEATTAIAIGRRRADQQFPIDAVANSVRVAVAVAYDTVAEAISGSTSPDGVSWPALRELWWRMTTFANRLTSLIMDGYVERQQERAAGRERCRGELVDDLLAAVVPDDVLGQRATALGVDISRSLGLLLVPATGTHVVETELRRSAPDALVGLRGSHAVVVVPLVAERRWSAVGRRVGELAQAHLVTVLDAGVCDTPAAVRERYAESAEALPYAPVVADGRGVVPFADLRLVPLVASASPVARRVAERAVIGRLEALPRGTAELVTTLVALVRNDFGVKQTARDVGRTVRTVQRRMTAIEQATGLLFSGCEGPALFAVAGVHRLLSPT